MQRWNSYLKSLGLTENEAGVYLYALKKGPQTVQQLARGTRISRVTVYAVIDSLTEMGLVSSVQKGKKKFFAAEPPERIVSVAETKVKKMETVIKEMTSHLQELKLLQSGDKPVVKFFEGPEAFKALQEDVLNSGTKKIYEMGNLDEIKRVYSMEDLTVFGEKLAEKKIKRELIYFVDKAEQYKEDETKNILYLRDNEFLGDIFFYNNKVWLSSFGGKQMAVMVESKIIADTFKELFRLVWKKY